MRDQRPRGGIGERRIVERRIVERRIVGAPQPVQWCVAVSSACAEHRGDICHRARRILWAPFSHPSTDVRLEVTAEQPQLWDDLRDQLAGLEHSDHGTF